MAKGNKPKKEKRGFLKKIFGKVEKPSPNLQPAITFKGYQANYVNYNNSILDSDLVLSAARMKARFFGKLNPRHIREENGKIQKISDGSIARLLRQPNEYQTPYDFLTQAYFMRELHDNCYIYPQYYISNAGDKIYQGMYILIPMTKPYIYENEQGKLYIEFIFPTYNEPVIFPLNDIIIWKKNYEDDQFLGGGKYTSAANADALNSLNTYQSIKETTANAAQAGLTFDGALKVNAFAADDEKLQNVRNNFINDLKNNATENGGIPVLDQGTEWINIQRQLKFVDAATLKEIKENLLIHTGVSIEMLEGKMSEADNEAFYQNWLEPAAISLGQAMSKCFFSQWQTTHGDRIELYASPWQLMSAAKKLELAREGLKAGIFSKNQALDLLGFPPIDGEDGDLMPRGYNNLDGTTDTVGGVNNE